VDASGEEAFVRIWDARSTFEAELIRKVLTEHGLTVLIPGEALDLPPSAQVGGNTVFVPTVERDRALSLLPEVWRFLSGADENDEENQR